MMGTPEKVVILKFKFLYKYTCARVFVPRNVHKHAPESSSSSSTSLKAKRRQRRQRKTHLNFSAREGSHDGGVRGSGGPGGSGASGGGGEVDEELWRNACVLIIFPCFWGFWLLLLLLLTVNVSEFFPRLGV